MSITICPHVQCCRFLLRHIMTLHCSIEEQKTIAPPEILRHIQGNLILHFYVPNYPSTCTMLQVSTTSHQDYIVQLTNTKPPTLLNSCNLAGQSCSKNSDIQQKPSAADLSNVPTVSIIRAMHAE